MDNGYIEKELEQDLQKKIIKDFQRHLPYVTKTFRFRYERKLHKITM